MSITLHALSFSWPDGTPVLDGVTATIGPGRTGLVAPNGGGKTTLLRLVTGELSPTGGSVAVDGVLGHLRQDLPLTATGTVADALGVAPVLAAIRAVEAGDADPAHFEVIGEDWDVEERATAQLDRLGLGGTALDRGLATLSGGQVVAVGLAGQLLRRPDVLLLDEPTNNLDRTERDRLAGVVEAFPARCWSSATTASCWTGWTAPPSSPAAGCAPSPAASPRGRPWWPRSRQRPSGTSAAPSRRSGGSGGNARRPGSGPSDGAPRRPGVPRTPASRPSCWAPGSGGPRSPLPAPTARTAPGSTTPGPASTGRGRAARRHRHRPGPARHPGAGRADRRRGHRCRCARAVPRGVDLSLRGPERVALTGGNGSGKTTLLRVLAGDLVPERGSVTRSQGRVAHLSQRLDLLDPGTTVADALAAAAPQRPEAERLTLLARFLFRGARAHLPVGALSGGERLRAVLACVLFAEPAPQLLLLDEPTNNLDLVSTAHLVAALEAYRGALVVVSHDERFLADLRLDRRVELSPATGSTAAPRT